TSGGARRVLPTQPGKLTGLTGLLSRSGLSQNGGSRPSFARRNARRRLSTAGGCPGRGGPPALTPAERVRLGCACRPRCTPVPLHSGPLRTPDATARPYSLFLPFALTTPPVRLRPPAP